jgi:hypothetical protein
MYVPLDCASGSVLGAKPSETTHCLSITRGGGGAGAMMLGPLVNGRSQTAMPFQFPLLFYYMAEAPSSTSTLISFFNFNPHCQLHPSSPLTSTLITFNFNPCCQHHPSSPTSILVTFNFNPRRLSISKPRRFSISSPSP